MIVVDSVHSSAMEALLKAAREMDSVEEMVGLCALIKLLPLAHKTFVRLIVGQLIEQETRPDAADPLVDFVGQDASKADSLSKQPLDKLITLLCFLKPDHPPSLRHALSTAVQQAYHHPGGSSKLLHQLVTMASIHPAFCDKDRETFAIWAASAVGAVTFPMVIASSTGEAVVPLSPSASLGTISPRSLSPMNSSLSHASLSPQNSAGSSGIGEGPAEQPPGKENAKLPFHAPLQAAVSDTAAIVRRTMSLMPPGRMNGGDPLHRSLSSSPNQEERMGGSRLDLNGSCSSMLNAEPFIHVPQPGMKDVPGWLKTLRLHKYCSLLANKTYEELIGITEAQLEAWNVTKGARGKIALSIQKLRDRPEELRQYAQQLHDPAQLTTVLAEVRNMLGTPIKMTTSPIRDLEKIVSMDQIPSNDIAARITFLVKKAAALRLSGAAIPQPEDDTSAVLLQITDRCLHHEAFYSSLRSVLQSIKHNLHLHLRPNSFQGHRKLTKCYTASGHSSSFDNRANGVGQPEFFGNGAEGRFRPLTATASVPAHRPLQRMYAVKGPATPASPIDPDKLLKPAKIPVGRTKSAPLSEMESNLWFDGLYPELETLTLSVTEHALDSFEHTSY
ncbi:protein Smaug homolog 1-like [Paramacrobiotus metropolitanus]|uniref:protein Smaug homolog 1-like n=1 Tax=Paramacrobiotus metropolitanus TaxID=2943436 RepID=UPI002445D921|nr:protein Smaug homolog 1-like [Paramacrobiotus metropolitanus]